MSGDASFWEELDALEEQAKPKPPECSFTALDYANQHGLSRSTAQQRLSTMVRKGILESEIFYFMKAQARYYWIKRG